MNSIYADSAQARKLDERLLGTDDTGAIDNWFDDSVAVSNALWAESESKRLASLPGRIKVAMGQMEACLVKQGDFK